MKKRKGLAAMTQEKKKRIQAMGGVAKAVKMKRHKFLKLPKEDSGKQVV